MPIRCVNTTSEVLSNSLTTGPGEFVSGLKGGYAISFDFLLKLTWPAQNSYPEWTLWKAFERYYLTLNFTAHLEDTKGPIYVYRHFHPIFSKILFPVFEYSSLSNLKEILRNILVCFSACIISLYYISVIIASYPSVIKFLIGWISTFPHSTSKR